MNIKSHFILSEAKRKVLKSFCSFDIQQDNVEISIKKLTTTISAS